MTKSIADDATHAIQVGDALLLRKLVRDEPSLVATPLLLHQAAVQSLECSEVLLDAGADALALDEWGNSPIVNAAGEGRVEILKALMSRGAPADGAVTAPSSPLMAAASEGHLEIARVLVEAGADLDRDSLKFPTTALSLAEELAPLKNTGQAEVARYLRSVGATKPWDYHRAEGFWDGAFGELTVLLVESCLGNVCAAPLHDEKTDNSRIVVRRTRHGWKTRFQTVFTSGLPSQGAACELAIPLTSKWPLHRRALGQAVFRCPIEFLVGAADRVLQGAEIRHGDVLTREHPVVAGLVWPGSFDQWLVVEHSSFVERRLELGDPDLPTVLLLVPHLEKKRLHPGEDAQLRADAKARIKWEKAAASGGKNNLVVPLCYTPTWRVVGAPPGTWY